MSWAKAGAANVEAAAPMPALARKWRLFMWLSPFDRSVLQYSRQAQALFACAVERDLIARIGVAHHAGRRVVPEHALDPLRRGIGAVAADHHARMLREPHSDAPAVMQADPCRPAGAIEKCVQK